MISLYLTEFEKRQGDESFFGIPVWSDQASIINWIYKHKKSITVNSTVEFVTVVMAIINTIASVAVWDTFAVATGEGVGSTLQCGGLVGRVVHTRLLVGQQLHAIRTATHPP